jgi:hypothetical protein
MHDDQSQRPQNGQNRQDGQRPLFEQVAMAGQKTDLAQMAQAQVIGL